MKCLPCMALSPRLSLLITWTVQQLFLVMTNFTVYVSVKGYFVVAALLA